jgi:predicted enzyme related to lactoylglutathione lyase
MKPTALLIPVDDLSIALKWYQQAFPDAVKKTDDEKNFSWLEIGGIALEPVYADHKVPSSRSGTVLYWEVEDLTVSIAHFKSIGAFVYRGPMVIGDEQGMCQVTDPFGNLIGLRGYFVK